MLALLTRVLGRWSRRLAAPSLALAVLQTVAVVKLASVEVLRILEGLEVIDVEVLDVRMLAVSSDVARGDNESDSIGATSQSHFANMKAEQLLVQKRPCSQDSATVCHRSEMRSVPKAPLGAEKAKEAPAKTMALIQEMTAQEIS